MSVICLEVRESNHRARALYESLGHGIGDANYYRRGDTTNAVLMQCLLASEHK